MKGRARLVARFEDGMTSANVVECRAPLALRLTGKPGPVLNVSILHTGAGFFEGDEAVVDLEIESGAAVAVTSPGATIAFPSRSGGWSCLRVVARIARGGFLSWLTEPLIAAAGCRHRVDSQLVLEQGAAAVWREEVCAGRHGEQAGELRLCFAADLGARPLLRDAVVFGPSGWDGPRALAGHRFTGTLACLGARVAPGEKVMQLAGPGSLVRSLALDAISLRRDLDRHREAALEAAYGGENTSASADGARLSPSLQPA